MTGQRVPDALIHGLRANGTLHHVADHLAQDLIEEREVHERVGNALLGLRGEILTFMTKHGLSAPPCDEPANIDSTLHCLRAVLEWAEMQAEARENPDSERT